MHCVVVKIDVARIGGDEQYLFAVSLGADGGQSLWTMMLLRMAMKSSRCRLLLSSPESTRDVIGLQVIVVKDAHAGCQSRWRDSGPRITL